MKGGRQFGSIRDLVDEAKKRTVVLAACIVGLSVLMSLTSPSVLVNLPASIFLIIILRYLYLDFNMLREAASYKSKQESTRNSSQRMSFECSTVAERSSNWKQKVNSPVVEDAIYQFSAHIVSEWVTDLWYSRLTPDRQGPEELVLIINGVLGEISNRMRSVNLIEILTRDITGLLCNRLELFRESKNKIEKQRSKSLTIEELDVQLKSVLVAENKLHPVLFSSEAEHKVLQHIVEGLISITFKHEDLQCSLFRCVVRELLACAVMRPVLNLATPRFINERIESLVISATKPDKGSKSENTESQLGTNGSPKISPDHISRMPNPSVKVVDLVPLKKDHNNKDSENLSSDNMNGALPSTDPLLSMDTQSTHSWSSLPEISNNAGQGIGGEWGELQDAISSKETEAPETSAKIEHQSMPSDGVESLSSSYILVGEGNEEEEQEDGNCVTGIDSSGLEAHSVTDSIISDSFAGLKCKVSCAEIVKCGRKTFAVYLISMENVHRKSWSIKRRFRHFEELHRLLKEFPGYELHLPTKGIFKNGVDLSVIKERYVLLDQYLQKLLQLQDVHHSIAVFDFLSVDSQMCTFPNPLSIINRIPFEKGRTVDKNQQVSHSASDSDSTIPSEWIPPNPSAPILDLVDVIFKVKDVGWIRRNVIWLAKQGFRLGMGDVFDSWLVAKIQTMQQGSFVASWINMLEKMLWPDGIFVTKHPRRKRPSSACPSSHISPTEDAKNLEEMKQKEADRRAKLVYEMLIDKTPSAVVRLLGGHKEFEVRAKDLYYFIQSSVCMKLLAFDLLQLLLLSAFPELEHVFKQFEEEEKFNNLISQ